MGFLKNAIRRAVLNSVDEGDKAFYLSNWNPSMSLMGHYTADEYASSYPNIRAISTDFMTIQPYAIDEKGNKVKAQALDALYHPNREDSSVAFFEKLAVMALTHSKTYILVWHRENGKAVPGGKITPDNIAGYTFLEYPSVTRRNGKTYYTVGANEYNEEEVMVIPGGVNPKNLYGGYSPSEASRRWAKVDDYIADYQVGFFENGAVPAGQFLITAPTGKEFNDIVDTMQRKHRGAGKNSNVTYAHQPIDPNTGKTAQAQIQWIPYAQTNKEIDFKNIFEQTNKRLDATFGVSQIVKGVDNEATYANAQVSEAGFAKRAVKPLALRIYTQITHELNRITNGLGVAITFTYDIPAVADEEKVRAETKAIEAGIITKLTVEGGYTLDSIIDALKLSPDYKKLSTTATTPAEEPDEEDIDEGDEVKESPDPSTVTGEAKGTNPKAEMSELDKEFYQTQMSAVVRKHMQIQIDEAIEKSRDDGSNKLKNLSKEQKDEFVEDMLTVIVSVLIAQGTIEYITGATMLTDAGFSTANLSSFVLSDKKREKYRKYLKKVGQSYIDDTADSIRKVLGNADELGLTKIVLEQNLQAIMQTDEWRVLRLSTTEINRSQSLAGVEAMELIAEQEEVTIEKALLHTGGDSPCEFCAVILGRWVKVGKPLIKLNETVIGEDGGIYVNDFVANDGYDIHPNGHCTSQFRVVRDE